MADVFLAGSSAKCADCFIEVFPRFAVPGILKTWTMFVVQTRYQEFQKSAGKSKHSNDSLPFILEWHLSVSDSIVAMKAPFYVNTLDDNDL